MTKWYIPTGKEFRDYRKLNKITQVKLSDLSGVSQSMISRIENDDLECRLIVFKKLIHDLEYLTEKKSDYHERTTP